MMPWMVSGTLTSPIPLTIRRPPFSRLRTPRSRSVFATSSTKSGTPSALSRRAAFSSAGNWSVPSTRPAMSRASASESVCRVRVV